MNQVTIDVDKYDQLKSYEGLIGKAVVFAYRYDYRTTYVIDPTEAMKELMDERDDYKKKYNEAITPKPKAPTRWQRLKKAW